MSIRKYLIVALHTFNNFFSRANNRLLTGNGTSEFADLSIRSTKKTGGGGSNSKSRHRQHHVSYDNQKGFHVSTFSVVFKKRLPEVS